MRLQTRIFSLTIGLLAAVILSITSMVLYSQRRVLLDQSAERRHTLMEGVDRIGKEALANRDRLMLVSYLMVLQKAHSELAFAAVTYRGHTANVGEDAPGLLYLERTVSAAPAPIRYMVTAYPEGGSESRARVTVSSTGVSIPSAGRVDVRVDEPERPDSLRVRLGFVKKAIDEDIAQALRPLVRRTLAISGVFAVLGIMASMYLSLIISAPIKALAAATAVASRAQAGEGTGDEVGAINARFGVMVERLKSLNQSREDLLHTLTHELNTPLGGLKAYLELWKDGKLPEKDLPEVLPTMVAAVMRMENSLGNALKLFKSEEAFSSLKPELVWVEEVFAEVQRLFEPVARSKGIRLNGLPEGAVGVVYAKGDAVRIAVTNLISNALKYTPDGGEISVGLKDSHDELKFWVKDTGRGIPSEDIPHLFTKFYRSEEERSKARRIPGTGLGLNITHRAITASGGKIWVESEPEKGSTFYVSFPKQVRAA